MRLFHLSQLRPTNLTRSTGRLLTDPKSTSKAWEKTKKMFFCASLNSVLH